MVREFDNVPGVSYPPTGCEPFAFYRGLTIWLSPVGFWVGEHPEWWPTEKEALRPHGVIDMIDRRLGHA